ncbi:MAG: acetyl-CoA carboxylase biotin carboxyl carrier protein subunit [Candidatus Promineifilaceae bacterium]|jgi:biotin carboxyl carrier protein
MADLKLRIFGEEIEFSVTRQGSDYHVEWDGRPAACRIRYLEDDYFVLEVTGSGGKIRHIHAAGSANGDKRQLWVDGQVMRYERVRRRGGAANLEGSLTATIPAIVTQVLVRPGDDVKSGEQLVLLESMKMIIPIKAPYDGTVAAIHCREGEAVQAGVQLVELTRKDEA